MYAKTKKIFFSGVSLIIASLCATSTDLIPYDPSTFATSSSSFAGNTFSNFDIQDPYHQLVSRLKSLKVKKGGLNPYIKAITTYRNSFLGTDQPSLESIQDKIAQESLEIPRLSMIQRAFSSLISERDSKNPVLPSNADHFIIKFSPDLLSIPSGFNKRDNPGQYLGENAKRAAIPTIMDAQTTTKNDNFLAGRGTISAPEILAHLKQFVAGQDCALEPLSFLAHRFMCNKSLLDIGRTRASDPSHCILTGPTGCGKSETLKRLGIFLGVPILHINARSLTDEGFKGQNFSECVANFCEDYYFPKSAIVAIDEIDKLGLAKESDSRSFGNAIQRVLLSPLDGNPVSAKGRQYHIQNWWFIGTGAFSGLKSNYDKLAGRNSTARSHEDIINAGFEPEFVGRFSSIIPFQGHTKETMLDVIKKEGSPLRKIQREFELFYGVDLLVDEHALMALAEASMEINLGVRSLNTILNVAVQPFYGRALELLGSSAEKVLNVTLDNVQLSIAEFMKSYKGSKEELPEYVKHIDKTESKYTNSKKLAINKG